MLQIADRQTDEHKYPQIFKQISKSNTDLYFRWLDYRMQRVKQKAEKSKEERENIELPEEKISVRGEPIPFKVCPRKNICIPHSSDIKISYFQAYIPMDEVIQYRKDQKAGGGRMVYKGGGARKFIFYQ